MYRILKRFSFLLLLVCAAVSVARAQVSVLTYRYDNGRTGQNTSETILTPANVNSNQFGKLYTQTVDGSIYAQPLYLPNLAIPGNGTRNVVFVATEVDSVYAFDADNNAGTNGTPLWKASLIDTAHGAASGAEPVTSTQVGCLDLQPYVGLTGTPVIDPTTSTLYVEAKSYENGVYVHRLHALDVATGAEKSPGPVVITATVPGTGDGSSGGQLTFDPLTQHSRPGLLLLNGTIYISFAGLCDRSPYHGWLFAYDEGTLTRKGVFNTTPNGGLGGFWMSGAGLAADTNDNLYVATGNGTFDTSNIPATELGDSILKVALSGGNLSLIDYFTPWNQASLDSRDSDLGSGGVVLLPDQAGTHPHELVQSGKSGIIRLLDRDQLTANNLHYCVTNCNNTDPQIVQEIQNALATMYSAPAYWDDSVYFWPSGDFLKVFTLSSGLLSASPSSESTNSLGFPGASPAVSAHGTTDGIVWAIDSSQYGSPGPGPGPAVLHAYDATNVSTELYNSTQAPNNRDRAGNAVKFAVPTVANGKVYIGTSTELDVFGLLPPAATPTFSPTPGDYSSAQSVTISDTTPAATIHYTADGTTPTISSAIYTGPITVSVTTTVEAMATATGYSNSAVASATYTFQGVASLALNPTTVVGGEPSTGTVVLTLPAPAGGAVVRLSSNSKAARVPPSVTVAAGSTRASFTITTRNVKYQTVATIWATLAVTMSAELTINH